MRPARLFWNVSNAAVFSFFVHMGGSSWAMISQEEADRWRGDRNLSTKIPANDQKASNTSSVSPGGFKRLHSQQEEIHISDDTAESLAQNQAQTKDEENEHFDLPDKKRRLNPIKPFGEESGEGINDESQGATNPEPTMIAIQHFRSPEIVQKVCGFLNKLSDVVNYGFTSNEMWKAVTSSPHPFYGYIKNEDTARKIFSSSIKVKIIHFYCNPNNFSKQTKDLLSQGHWIEYLYLDKDLPDFPLLTKCTRIAGLDLRHIKLEAKGMKYLMESLSLHNLETLCLAGCEIGDDGAEMIAKNEQLTNLSTLYLAGTGILETGVRKLMESKHLINLKALDLQHNNIQAGGVKAIVTRESSKKLVTLNLSNCNIGFEGLKSVANSQNLINLRELSLEQSGISPQGIREFTENIIHLTNLKKLSLKSNNIGDEGLKIISECSALRGLGYLDLGFNQISDEGLKYVAQNTYMDQLEYLDLEENSGISHDGLNIIGKSQNLKNLKILNLKGARFKDPNSSYFSNVLSHFGHFIYNINQFISRSTISDEDGAKDPVPTTQISKLTSLNLENTHTDSEIIKGLVQLPYLTNLKSLNLKNNDIDDYGADIIMKSETFQKLLNLHLGSNKISPETKNLLLKSFGNRVIL